MHVIGLHLFVRDFFPSVLTFLMNGEARKNVWNIISIFVDDFVVFECLKHSFNFGWCTVSLSGVLLLYT